MKKSIIILLIALMFTFISCSSTKPVETIAPQVVEKPEPVITVPVRQQLYLTECALPGDGSNLLPGTFELPGTMTLIPLGGVIVEQGYAYISSAAKITTAEGEIDYTAAAEEARMQSREALAKFFSSNYKTGTAFTDDNRTTNSEYSTTSITFSGLTDCGYCLDEDGTVYILSRILVSDVAVLEGGYEESVFDLMDTKIDNLESAVASINEELLNR